MKRNIIIVAIILALMPTGIYAQEEEGFEVIAHLDYSTLRANGVPSDVHLGVNNGFSLPIWTTPINQNEELYFLLYVPDQWDDTSNFIIHFNVAIAEANDTKNFNLQASYTTWTPDVDIVPITSTDLTIETATGNALQYQSYEIEFSVNATGINHNDVLAYRLRRIAASSDEIAGEVLIFHSGAHFIRGDFADFLEDSQVEAFSFLFLPLALTLAFYFSRQPPLGFASGGAWFIYGTYALSQSTTTWDNYYALFIFCAIALTLMCFLHALNLRKAGIAGAAEQTDADLKAVDDSLWGKDKNALYYTVDDSYRIRAKKKKAIRRNAMEQGMKEGEAGRF